MWRGLWVQLLLGFYIGIYSSGVAMICAIGRGTGLNLSSNWRQSRAAPEKHMELLEYQSSQGEGRLALQSAKVQQMLQKKYGVKSDLY